MGIKRAVEMAKLWDGEISDRTLSRALKKIGFTRKKRLTATANEMKSNGRLL
jgi:transposase